MGAPGTYLRLSLLPGLPLLFLAACATGPIPLAQAEAECADRARAALRPTGSATIGASSKSGLSTGISIGVTTDFLAGRDPQDVYASCVESKSGQPPQTPLVLR